MAGADRTARSDLELATDAQLHAVPRQQLDQAQPVETHEQARPREFLEKSWLESSADLLLAALLVIGLAAALGILTWRVVLFSALVANANQIHKWAHMNRVELPRVVHWPQRAYLLQTPRHHGRHLGGTRTTHYCVITNFLNPLLEEVGFWKRIETAIEHTTGVKRRSEDEELLLLGMTPRPKPRPCPQCRAEAC